MKVDCISHGLKWGCNLVKAALPVAQAQFGTGRLGLTQQH